MDDSLKAGGLGLVAEGLRRMLPAGVGVGVGDPRENSVGSLFHVEHQAMQGVAPKRLREFAAGRSAARRAQLSLGLSPSPVGVAADRSPVWPDGLCGSISHCTQAAVALVAVKGVVAALGVDIEDDRPLPEDIADTVLDAQERSALRSAANGKRDGLLIFSAKEAVYKAQYPITGQLMGFDALRVDLSADRSGFTARFLISAGQISEGYVARGFLSCLAGMVISVVVLPRQP